MGKKLLNILIHPLFLALLITGIIIPLFPDHFDRYEAERLNKEQLYPLGQDKKKIYEHSTDIFKGGRSEAVQLWSHSYYHALKVLDSNGATLGHFTPNAPSRLASDQVFFCDDDGDDVQELYVFPQSQDSLFIRTLDINAVDPEEKEDVKKEDWFDTKLVDTIFFKNPKKNYRAKITCGTCKDVDKDGSEELLFIVATAFSAQPRNLYIYNRQEDLVKKSPSNGAYIFSFKLFDLTGDGKQEIILEQTKAHGNIHPKLGISYPDTCSYLMVLNQELEFLFEPRAFPYMSSETHVAPFRTEEGKRLAVLYEYTGERDEDPALMLFDEKGKRIKKRKVGGHKKKNGRNIFSSKNGERLYYRDLEGTIHLLDEELKQTGIKALEGDKVEYVEQKDLDSDGIHELLFASEDMERLFITRKDLSHSVELKIPTKNPSVGRPFSPLTLKKEKDGSKLLSVQNGNMKYLFEYASNPYYNLKYGIFGGLYLGIALFIFVIQKLATYKLERDKEKLEEVVAERTEELQKAFDDLEYKHAELQEKNRAINESIDYAEKIQSALLQSQEHVSSHLPDHFIFLKPQEKVSGDFHWAKELHGHLYVAAVDCTGHGVPGAFMSMLGVSLLNEILDSDELLSPGEVLTQLRERVIRELSGDGEESTAKDGMDAAMIRFPLQEARNPDQEGIEVEFAGAQNPLYVIREGIAKESTHESTDQKVKPFKKNPNGIEVKGDPKPVGYDERRSGRFQTVRLNLKGGDKLYLFSDGFADQFGGEKGKKFRYGPFKELLTEISEHPMAEQKAILEERFEAWKADHEQIDDVLVIGVELS